MNAYSASYMEYEFNVKNTWAFWIDTVSPQLPSGDEGDVDEVHLARLLTSFTEKFEDNKVSVLLFCEASTNAICLSIAFESKFCF